MKSMLTPELIADDARRQVALAALAETEEVRAVHRALEQLYRTQLVAMELAARLPATDDRADPDQDGPLGRIPLHW